MHEIAGKIHSGSTEWQITDSRSPFRFSGEGEEPPHMRAGHITGSTNLFYSWLVDEETGCLKADAEMKEVFTSNGVALSGK